MRIMYPVSVQAKKSTPLFSASKSYLIRLGASLHVIGSLVLRPSKA